MDFRDNNRLASPEVVSLNEPSAATRRHQGAKCFFSTHKGEMEKRIEQLTMTLTISYVF